MNMVEVQKAIRERRLYFIAERKHSSSCQSHFLGIRIRIV